MGKKFYEDNAGRFGLGDYVTWQAGRHKPWHTGTIVQVVPRGLYPDCCPNEKEILKERRLKKEDVVWKNLFHCGYYRDHESYVVEDGKGKRWWPRVGNLMLIERSRE